MAPVLIDRFEVEDRKFVFLEILKVVRINDSDIDDSVAQVQDGVEQADKNQFVLRRPKDLFKREVVNRPNSDGHTGFRCERRWLWQA